MQNLLIKALAAAMLVGAGTGAMTDVGHDQKPDVPRDVLNPMVGGQAMLVRASIFENASKSPEHSTLAAAIRAAGLEPLLKAKGPYTIFAPTDTAYAALPQRERDALIHANRVMATKSVGYLIVPGRLDSQALLKRINENEGQATLKTLEGGTLTAMLNGPTNIVLVDERGHVADISTYDVYQKNGVMQIIDQVVRPN
jgi:uncharacterized surface protein with fasciclin (FAS1) repeats